MPDATETVILMPCQEEGCKEQVRYKREVLFGFMTQNIPVNFNFGSENTVYLTCAKKHTHSYVIPNQ
jgi:hypothetical protein